MDILNILLAVSEPKGMWESIIKWIQGGVGNYALTIIILTLIIKFIMLPLDFYQRYIGKVNARKQAKLQPELDKINARYANNKDLLNQKTMELYKKENYNVVGTCAGMFIYMIATLVVFFTMFRGINNMQYYNIDKEYVQLQQTYITTIVDNYDGEVEILDENDNFVWANISQLDEATINKANEAVLAKYDQIKTSFLWIKNVWIPDNYSKVIPSYEKYLKNTNQKANSDATIAENNELAYNLVMSPLMDKYGDTWNGYMILPLLAMGLTISTAFIPQLVEKIKAKKRGVVVVKQSQQTILMIIIMPIILGLFTLFYNAVFALYIVTGGVIGLFTTPLMTLATDALDAHAINKEKSKHKEAEYSRRQPVDITNAQKQNKNNTKNKNKVSGTLKSITKSSQITKNNSNNSKNKNTKNNNKK